MSVTFAQIVQNNSAKPCPHCGVIHSTTCPRIKAIEYYPDGSIKRVELRP